MRRGYVGALDYFPALFRDGERNVGEYQRRIVLAVGGAEIVDCYFGLALGVVEPYFVVNA